MACRGVLFAITSEQTQKLLSLKTDEERIRCIQDDIEEGWDEQNLLETDKAWDAIHRCLTNGHLNVGCADGPMGKIILGGKQVYSGEDYIINFIKWEEIPEILSALEIVSKDWMKARYEALRNTDYFDYPVPDQDWEYTWAYFSDIPDFLKRALNQHRNVIFTVDQ